ncbi:molybdopterin-dependent oxidoreductase [Kitasatospora viridis]|uniref:Molybdopterin-dependent oxidoreductase-like protein n=1 Tax=Kitasatospora viridis TaxID=281105 RepID=A0A561SAB4_9ACTN|nr:molybdopterin-dependent oxidoreductase [Kitasatospora viridis]TWF71823.1 molybdopterin-dependent oxidoreductase-like protein [Kitasatospora viridis]
MHRSAAFRFHGHLDAPVELTVAQLRDLPVHQVQVSFDCRSDGEQRHGFEGPKLWDVLCAARPQVDLTGRKERPGFVLTVKGADGHQAVLSWAEIDPDFGGQQVLLATSMDGTPLDEAGPQLVVPADHCGARYVSGITEVWVGRPQPAQ